MEIKFRIVNSYQNCRRESVKCWLMCRY